MLTKYFLNTVKCVFADVLTRMYGSVLSLWKRCWWCLRRLQHKRWVVWLWWKWRCFCYLRCYCNWWW